MISASLRYRQLSEVELMTVSAIMLKVPQQHFKHIHLSHVEMNDEQLEHFCAVLIDLSSLETLWLDGNEITHAVCF